MYDDKVIPPIFGLVLVNASCFEVGLRTRRIEFIDENGGGPGVRLRKRQRPKKTK